MICPSCNEEFTYHEGMKFCPKCGEPLPHESEEIIPREALRDDVSAAAPEEKTSKIPWEDKDLSLIEKFWNTFVESVFNPTVFFKKMEPKGDIFLPLLYAVIWVIISQIVGFFYFKLFGSSIIELFREIMEARGIPLDDAFNTDMMFMQGIGQMFMLPLLYMLLLFIIAGILHVFLLIFGAGKQGYVATFRTIAYSQGSGVFNIIPFLGNSIATLWGIVLQIIGFKEVHRTTYGKVILAVVVIPLILCAFCCGFVIIMIVGAVGASSINV